MKVIKKIKNNDILNNDMNKNLSLRRKKKISDIITRHEMKLLMVYMKYFVIIH